MTDLSNKNKIITALAFICYSAVLVFCNYYAFSAVYFIAVGAVIALACITLADCEIKNKTVAAFLVTATGYEAFFAAFHTSHTSDRRLMAAIAVFVFFSGVFLLTHKKLLPLSIAAAPVLCILNLKIAACYCAVLLCHGIVDASISKGKKAAVSAVIIGAVCLAVCAVLALTGSGIIKENINFLLSRFKNLPAVIASAVYLAVRTFRCNKTLRKPLTVSLIILTASTVFFCVTLGWTALAIMLFTAALFLGLCCVRDKNTLSAVISDYHAHRYLFVFVAVCLLQ